MREDRFNGKSQVCNIELILMGEGSWIQQEKKDSQESFQGEITGSQYWAYINGGLNLREAGFNRKRRVARTHYNRKFHIYNIWPTSMGEI